GWYGDEEGHSDASREGWEHRGGRRTRGYDQEDDYQGSSRGRGGSRDYDEDEDNYQSSSRNGGRSRNYDEDEDNYQRSSRGRAYDEDDDYQRSSGRGASSRSGNGRGWYGDEEGHSEA